MNPLAVYNAMYYDQRLDGHDDDHRPRRREHRPDHRRRRDDLAALDPDRRQQLHRGAGQGVQAATSTRPRSSSATPRPASTPGRSSRRCGRSSPTSSPRSSGRSGSTRRCTAIRGSSRSLALGGTFRLPGLAEVSPAEPAARRRAARHARRPAPPADAEAGADVQREPPLDRRRLRPGAAGDGRGEDHQLAAARRRSAARRCGRRRPSGSPAAAALFVVGTGIPLRQLLRSQHAVRNAKPASARSIRTKVQGEAQDHDWTRLATIQNLRRGDRERIKNVRSLTEYRDLWPQILADLNTTIPKLPPDPAKLKAIPRNQREMVNVDSIVTKYEPNLGAVIADPDFKCFAGATGSAATVGSFQIPAAAGGTNAQDAALMDDPAMLGLVPRPTPTRPRRCRSAPVAAAN